MSQVTFASRGVSSPVYLWSHGSHLCHREQDRLLKELSEFLRIPSVSALPAHAADCRRAAEWLRDELTRLGCPKVQVIEGNGHPVVWAKARKCRAGPPCSFTGTTMFSPPTPSTSGSARPSSPRYATGKLYARGAADDKGQVFCLLKAYEAVLRRQGRPPLNVHFIFEGEEECGGRVVFDLLRSEPERTRADAALVCDSSYYAQVAFRRSIRRSAGSATPRSPSARSSAICTPGSYGGVAPNALETLVRILSQLKGADGEIQHSQAVQGRGAAHQA